MELNLDHAHLFASNIDETIAFWQTMFGATLEWDREAAGVRNVYLRIGRGAINLYDQPPRHVGSGSVHHLGIETDDLDALVAHMQANGFQFRKPINELPTFRYVMVAAPDNVLVELFQTRRRAAP
jgi:catechol 2,3-dioxygenase-like lactoylglutathione lyase family enzyme